MQELELKLLIDNATAKEIWNRAVASGLASVIPRARRVDSTYVDTPDYSLRRNGISFRLRRDGKRLLQTVKAHASLHGGMSNVTEVETVAPGGRLDIAAIPEESLRDETVETVKGAALKPVCETLVKRTEGDVRSQTGTRALLAVDVAEIKADGQSGKFYELELEHLEGPPGGLFDIARTLLPDGGVKFSRKSKAERGYLLAETGNVEPEPCPRKANTVSVAKSQTAEQAAQQVLRECAGQIVDNIDAVLHLSAAEGPHQLRIGLRRLRSSLQVFKSAVGSPIATHLGQEAKWLGQQVGQLRDLDVVLHELVLPAGKASSNEPGFALLASMLEEECSRVRDDLRMCLKSNRVQAFLFDLMRFIETRGWLKPEDESQLDKLAAPVRQLAAAALNKQWTKVRKRARHLRKLSIEERHELRKELKKLRYAVEFVRPLYSAKKLKPFLIHLKKLQQLFGDLNDAAMVRNRLLQGTIAETDTKHVQRAIGWIVGASSTRAEIGWEHAQELWKSLKNTSEFWK